MPLLRFNNQHLAERIAPRQFHVEKQLQQIVEANLKEIFGVRFIDSEFVIRGEQPGRMDTLGLDQENAPTIIEYKRAENENVINQGLYYMNWLVEHRGDFELAAQHRLGHEIEVDWSHPRLIIIAQSYKKWDTYAVNQMGAAIELWHYVVYGDDLLHLEPLVGQQRKSLLPTAVTVDSTNTHEKLNSQAISDVNEYSLDYHLAKGSEKTRPLFHALRDRILAFASEEGEIIETPNKLYMAYRRGRNFCEVEIQAKALKITLDVALQSLQDPEKLARDVSNVSKWGTGDVQIKLETPENLDYVLGLIAQTYQQTK